MKYEYDPSADALYMTIRPGRSARTIEVHDHTVLLDVDEYGWVLGIEVLQPPPALLRRLAEVQGTHPKPRKP